MNLLAIDTSTEKATLALSIGNEIVCEEQTNLHRHAQVLLPMLERLLASTSCSLKQLDAIVFGRGPGSFTGLRIACSMAKALAYAHDLLLYPVSCLSTIAWQAYELETLEQQVSVLAVMDARMKEYYWGCFSSKCFTTEEKVTLPDLICSYSKPVIVAGVGFDASKFNLILQQQIVKEYIIYPEAQFMLKMVRAGGLTPVSPADALPVYLRNQVTQGESRG